MTHRVVELLSYSLFIPGVIGAIRARTIRIEYYPFLILLWIGCVNEVISSLFIRMGYPTIMNVNIYFFVEAMLILLLFQKLALLKHGRNIFYVLYGFYLALWLFEVCLLHSTKTYAVYFNMVYASCTVALSIHTINHLVVSESQNLLKSGLFWIVIGFIIYFTYKILVNAFWLYGLTKDTAFLKTMAHIMVYINLITNLIFALATLWIPRKVPSSLQF